ncbi:GYD domain-containing protein [Tropicibacter sp. Alg240-R139]|uniref:GYD domain-containing protein n=1 Tax=Tropicibacter sp. Alg240-R139 TaxID=2305991 RepID=UPI0013E09368|nr:GYD domain-containing protein [Tropicibacter sp. Alg240-R139]
MPLFITYASYSTSGLQGLLAKPEDRGPAIQALMDKVGAKVVALYFTTGSNDVVMVSEAVDGTDTVALGMAVAVSGSVQNVETVRAWSSADFAEIASKAASLTDGYTPPGS